MLGPPQRRALRKKSFAAAPVWALSHDAIDASVAAALRTSSLFGGHSRPKAFASPELSYRASRSQVQITTSRRAQPQRCSQHSRTSQDAAIQLRIHRRRLRLQPRARDGLRARGVVRLRLRARHSKRKRAQVLAQESAGPRLAAAPRVAGVAGRRGGRRLDDRLCPAGAVAGARRRGVIPRRAPRQQHPRSARVEAAASGARAPLRRRAHPRPLRVRAGAHRLCSARHVPRGQRRHGRARGAAVGAARNARLDARLP